MDHDDDLREPLARFVDAVRAGRGPVTDAHALSRYDMVNVTAELAAILDRLASGRRLVTTAAEGTRSAGPRAASSTPSSSAAAWR